MDTFSDLHHGLFLVIDYHLYNRGGDMSSRKSTPLKERNISKNRSDSKLNKSENQRSNEQTVLKDLSYKLQREQIYIIKIQAAHREMTGKAMLLEAMRLYFNTYPIPELPSL